MPMSSWTQPQCASCYNKENPGRQAVIIGVAHAEQEVCCTCGQYTQEGIYTRKDPNLVPYPRKDKD